MTLPIFRINGVEQPNLDSMSIPNRCQTTIEKFEYLWANVLKPEILKHDHVTFSPDLASFMQLTDRLDPDTLEIRLRTKNSEFSHKVYEKLED